LKTAISEHHVLVTGANGFIGRALCHSFEERQIFCLPVMRQDDGSGRKSALVEDINGFTDWSSILSGISAIVHLAARVHVLNDDSTDPLTEFRRTNVHGTLNMARQAAAHGVNRFIYLSSIKVNGEETYDRPFGAEDIPAPVDPYGISKFEAETGLQKIADETGMEIVIIRPPLVYGRGVGGNFGRLLALVKRGVPLPLAAIRNRRSLVYVENLCDLIRVCLWHPKAPEGIQLVADGDDVSTPDLIREMVKCCGRQARMVSVPVWLLRLAGRVTGHSHEIKRLCGNLQVDSSATREKLLWQPPFTLEQGLQRTIS
jgi:nucleoside-diphosphate-sugar epimerase